MKNNIKVGDVITLGKNNGLGQNPFVVIEVFEKDPIHKLLVLGANRLGKSRDAAKIVVDNLCSRKQVWAVFEASASAPTANDGLHGLKVLRL